MNTFKRQSVYFQTASQRYSQLNPFGRSLVFRTQRNAGYSLWSSPTRHFSGGLASTSLLHPFNVTPNMNLSKTTTGLSIRFDPAPVFGIK